MAIERAPAPTVGSIETLRRYRPPSREVAWYHVTQPGRSETLESVARANGVALRDLVAFNFPGSVVDGVILQPVVNWYMGRHVEFGCPDSRDGRNRALRGHERLAIPRPGTFIELDDPVVTEGRVAPARRGVWFGGGYKTGTTPGSNVETARIACVAADGTRGFTATLAGTGLGVGAEAGDAPIIVLITSLRSPGQLDEPGEGRLELARPAEVEPHDVLGGRHGRAGRALGRFAEKYGRRGAAGLEAGRTLLKYGAEIVDLAETLGMQLDHPEPQVLTVESSWSALAADAPFLHSVSKFRVESVLSF
ncbi:MAG: hypothetical protein PVI57_08820 [Gemmatimonadota bacterium]|jgi:hypothetical protein